MLNNTSLDSFIKELQQLNYDYFVWVKAHGRLGVGSGFEPPNVFMDDGFGTLVPAKIHFDPEVGIIIRK